MSHVRHCCLTIEELSWHDRNDVLAAAQRVLNADPAASTSAVAEAAGISRATLHRHFDSRESLLVELGTRSLDQWEQRLDDVDVEALAAAGDPVRLREALETLVLGYVDDSDGYGFALTDQVILANAALEERTQVLADREAVLFAAAQARRRAPHRPARALVRPRDLRPARRWRARPCASATSLAATSGHLVLSSLLAGVDAS